MMEGLQISIPQRMMLLRITLIMSVIISIFLSIHAWGGYRVVPYAPVIDLPQLRAPFDFIYPAFVILFLIASMFLNKHRLFIFFALALSTFMVLMDINRLQPWFYIYNAMLAVFLFYNGRVDDSNKFTSYFIILQIIFASVYFFCGLSQLNSLFVETDFNAIISPLRTMMSERQFLFFKKMGFIAPYALMFIGLGLIISPIRYLAITVAIVIHVLLFVLLFPSAKNQNYALWFSNLSFIVMLILMFSGKTKQRYFSPTFLFQIPVFYVAMVVFVVMPFFNNSGQWPDFLSGNFKSGNTISAKISVSEQAKQALPVYVASFCVPDYTFYDLEYTNWYLHELNIDCFPHERVFNSIYKYLGEKNHLPVKEIELQMVPRQKLLRKP